MNGAEPGPAGSRSTRQRGPGPACLRRATLRNAVLDGADLRAADLTGAHVAGISLVGARMDSALWVDGSQCAANSIGECVRHR